MKVLGTASLGSNFTGSNKKNVPQQEVWESFGLKSNQQNKTFHKSISKEKVFETLSSP